MVDIARLTRLHRRTRTASRVARPIVIALPTKRSTVPDLRRALLARRDRSLPDEAQPPTSELNPYVDYARYLTAEGGVLIVYKDLDVRWRHTLWRLFAFACFTGPEAWAALRRYDDANPWFAIASIAAAAILNIVIVAKPVELYRQIEIRPDCLIIEGEAIFWKRFMDGGWPSFHANAEGNAVLSGIYGTRFVEYLTVRRFDEHDRMPSIFAAHLHGAMQQLWTQPP